MTTEDAAKDLASGRRAVRFDTHRVRLGTSDGILLNLSATGALVRMPERLTVGASPTLSLYADDRWLQLRCSVVRCIETDVKIAGAVWHRTEFETAVTFHDAEGLANLMETIGRHRRG
jgi:hypothetical protein